MKPISENDLEQLSAYLDGELSDSERRFFQKRLSNDAELRAYCERVWIASSVLKSQPIHLMPENSVDLICSQCTQTGKSYAMPIRLIASFGALAIVAVLGFQLLKPKQSPLDSIVKNSSPIQVVENNSSLVMQSPNTKPESVNSQTINATQAPLTEKVLVKPSDSAAQLTAQNDPAQFELNESTRSKTWPKSNQGIDDYLARHNQMIDANANSGLISYAQILTDQESIDQETSVQQQADQ